MREYKDPRGGLTIEKSEPVKSAEKKASRTRRKENTAKSVNADMILDTAYSYQNANFVNNPKGDGSECVFCGEKTSYANRHVCATCWKMYNEEIFNGLKNATEDVEIRIE